MKTKADILKEINVLDIEIASKNKRRGELSEKLDVTKKQIDTLTVAITLATVEAKDTTKENAQLISLKTEAENYEGAINLINQQIGDAQAKHTDLKRGAARMDFDAVFDKYTIKVNSTINLLQQVVDNLKQLETILDEASKVGAHAGATLESVDDDQRMILQIANALNAVQLPGFLVNLRGGMNRSFEYMQKKAARLSAFFPGGRGAGPSRRLSRNLNRNGARNMNTEQTLLVTKKIKQLRDSNAITLKEAGEIYNNAKGIANRLTAAQFREHVNQIGASQSKAMPTMWSKATYHAYVQGRREAAFNAYHEANRERGKVQSIVMFT